jgi:hypothetical protein
LHVAHGRLANAAKRVYPQKLLSEEVSAAADESDEIAPRREYNCLDDSLCRSEAVTMKKLEMFVAFALLAAASAAAPQQLSPPAPAPAPSPTQSPQPQAKPPLKLRLDEVERRPAITFGRKDDATKKDAAQSLPGLGGNPSKAWENPAPSTVIPPTNDNY